MSWISFAIAFAIVVGALSVLAAIETRRGATRATDAAVLGCLLVVALLLVLAAVKLLVPAAYAHDAPKGWSYPFACCSGYDCREVPATAIGELPDGYRIKATGEEIKLTDGRLKASPDGLYHWRSIAGAADGKTICLFVPPKAY